MQVAVIVSSLLSEHYQMALARQRRQNVTLHPVHPRLQRQGEDLRMFFLGHKK